VFIRLLAKELKYLLRSVSFYILLAVITVFYFSQFEFPGKDASLKPLSEMEFMYKTMITDYEAGALLGGPLTGNMVKLSDQQAVKLTDGQMEALEKAIEAMSGDDGVVDAADVDRDRYLGIVRTLNEDLGGNTYYGDSLREQYLDYNLRYGQKPLEDPVRQMEVMFGQMVRDYYRDQIESYKFGFSRTIRFGEKERQAIRDAMNKMTPSGADALELSYEELAEKEFSFTIGYDEFLEVLRTLDRNLGGRTHYGDSMRGSLLTMERTYEEALAEFNTIVEKDKITNAYARLFADYMGITAGFFPAFIAAFILLKDRRRRMDEVICSRRVDSVAYVGAKYAVIVISVSIFYLVLATHATTGFHHFAKENGYAIDYFAFYKYSLIWIVPTLAFTVSLGMLVSVVFNSGIPAIPLQFAAWLISIMPLSGDYRLFKYIIRFNQVASNDVYARFSPDIANNRLFFTLVSAVLFALAVYIWSKRRNGAVVFDKNIIGARKA
jgi:hypothetical protein